MSKLSHFLPALSTCIQIPQLFTHDKPLWQPILGFSALAIPAELL